MNHERMIDPVEIGRKRVEDAFFIANDKALIEKQKTLKKMRETKASLTKVSGIHNEAVLEKLVELEVRPETLASLAVIPLIEVAWADGAVSKKEETAVLAAAAGMGIKKGGIEYGLLEQWLTHKPPQKMMDAWVHYIQGLGERLTKQEKSALKAELLGQAMKVAGASGGVLGVGAVSKEEKDVIKKMEQAFD
jgi:hypothetical protein